MSNWFKYYRPRFDWHFAPELWFDETQKGEYYFHLFSIQFRRKYGITGVMITALGFTCLVTSLAFSDFVDGYLTSILNKPTEDDQDV